MTKVTFKIYLFSLPSFFGNCYDVSVVRNKPKKENTAGKWEILS